MEVMHKMMACPVCGQHLKLEYIDSIEYTAHERCVSCSRCKERIVFYAAFYLVKESDVKYDHRGNRIDIRL